MYEVCTRAYVIMGFHLTFITYKERESTANFYILCICRAQSCRKEENEQPCLQ